MDTATDTMDTTTDMTNIAVDTMGTGITMVKAVKANQVDKIPHLLDHLSCRQLERYVLCSSFLKL